MTTMLGAVANRGVGSWAQRQARVYPDHVALVGAGQSLTYADLAARVRRLANGLLRMGVERGDRVSIADAGVVQVVTEAGRHVIAAIVVPAAGTKVTGDEVLEFCRQRLPPHQVPAMVTLADRLPRSSVGKLVRTELRDLATEPAS